MYHLIIIRYYKPGDELFCREIVKDGTMSTVNAAFIAGLTREITFQTMILTSAILFIFLGVPFSVCFCSIPAVIILMYVFIWLGHTFKALEMTQDVSNIPRVYMSSEYTGFWVAEAHEPYFMTRDPNQIKYKIMTEREIIDNNIELADHHVKKIVGTIAITRSRHCDGTAWLRRMAVNPKYQRKGIASVLVDEALRFCKDKGYSAVELVTSECHDAARELYLKKGFDLKQMYHKPIVGTVVTVQMYDLVFHIKPNDKPLEF
ncbi:probable N-acetyltransferase CML3 [Zootermopsis nevadensis]|uniref:Putative N-acetyltransferase CML3 n=1 Tax=Zootermopsis nevadensis TaxID=136037 RepID=A0A067R894_ZOONE|nr:probable N-acetyltransferase CML3 [Zootermopsis nevadensis]KDR18719.1 putative N-acetyltransferase CML3 [Zootermopsis nevadensis]